MELSQVLIFIIGALVIVILTGNAVIIRMRPNIGGDNSHERSGGGIFGFLFSIFLIIVLLTFTTDRGNWLPEAWNDLLKAGDASGEEIRKQDSSSTTGELTATTSGVNTPVEEETLNMPETVEQLQQQTENYGSGVGAHFQEGGNRPASTEGQVIYIIQKNAYGNWDNAFHYKTQLLKISAQVLILEVADAVPYRVGFGPYDSEREAKAAQERLGVGGTIKSYLFN
ncbi:MAG: hypothetical protein AAF433_13180 [Bacteroidota bacterium]